MTDEQIIQEVTIAVLGELAIGGTNISTSSTDLNVAPGYYILCDVNGVVKRLDSAKVNSIASMASQAISRSISAYDKATENRGLIDTNTAAIATLNGKWAVYNEDSPFSITPASTSAINANDDGRFWLWDAANQTWHEIQLTGAYLDVSWLDGLRDQDDVSATQLDGLLDVLDDHRQSYIKKPVKFYGELAQAFMTRESGQDKIHVINCYGEHWEIDVDHSEIGYYEDDYFKQIYNAINV